MRRALCKEAKRESFFTEFEQRHLRPEEDPSVHKWELENILSKADPSLSNDAKTALLTRAILEGSTTDLKIKHNPIPTIGEMVEFTQRFRVLGCSAAAETVSVQVNAVSRSSSDPQLKGLFTMVADIAAKQQALEDRMKHTDNSTRVSPRPGSNSRSCYTCGLQGHLARECTRQRSFAPQWNVTCFNSGKPGSFARECKSTCSLNF